MGEIGNLDASDFIEFNEFAAMCYDRTAVSDDLLNKYVHEVLCDIGDPKGLVDRTQLMNFFGRALTESDIDVLFTFRVGKNINSSDTLDGDHLDSQTICTFIKERSPVVVEWDG